MTFQRILTALLLIVVLTSCAPVPAKIATPTNTFTSTPSPTDTPTSTPTIVPTATPHGGGESFPRVAIFTELEPDDSAAGYIRIAEVDINKGKLLFSTAKLQVGTKPGSLPGYGERYPPLMRWSPDGKSYIGYQFANKKGGYYIPLIKMVIVDAASNSVIKEYELNYDQVNSIYGYSLETRLMDSTGPLGIDIYWK